MDGVMIGRGIFGHPWFFSGRTPDIHERLLRAEQHAELFEKKFNGIKNFSVMKKHFKSYVAGLDGARELRIRLMEVENALEVRNIIEDYLRSLKKESMSG